MCTRLARKRCKAAWHFSQYLRATNCYKLSDRGVITYSPLLEEAFHRRKRPVWVRWRMDEIYIRVRRLLDSRVGDCTMAYHPIFVSRILLEVRMFQGSDTSVERCRRPGEHTTLESKKRQFAHPP